MTDEQLETAVLVLATQLGTFAPHPLDVVMTERRGILVRTHELVEAGNGRNWSERQARVEWLRTWLKEGG